MFTMTITQHQVQNNFDREGLHQLHNSFVAVEDLHGRDVLLFPGPLPREVI